MKESKCLKLTIGLGSTGRGGSPSGRRQSNSDEALMTVCLEASQANLRSDPDAAAGQLNRGKVVVGAERAVARVDLDVRDLLIFFFIAC